MDPMRERRRRTRALLFPFWVGLVAALPPACKAPGKSTSSALAAGDAPARVQGVDRDAPGRKIGRLGAGGGSRIVVDLAKPRAAGDGFASCWPRLTADLPLGRAVCEADPRLGLEYTAAAADLTCSADAAHGVLRASRPLSMKDCKVWSVYVYDFEPELQAQIGD
jgi:hypothetical protein